jgi:hypothetical protein
MRMNWCTYKTCMALKIPTTRSIVSFSSICMSIYRTCFIFGQSSPISFWHRLSNSGQPWISRLLRCWMLIGRQAYLGHKYIFNSWSKVSFSKHSGKDTMFGSSDNVKDFRVVICFKASSKPSTIKQLPIANISRQVRYLKSDDRLNRWHPTISNTLREWSPCNTSFVNELMFGQSLIYSSWRE